MFEFWTSMPESPPSPVTGRNHVLEPVYASVPLSCVPPNARVSGLLRSTNRFWNWSVSRPAFRVTRLVGTLLSQALQSVRSDPDRPREPQAAESFVHCPFVRIIPPSEPTKQRSGFVGTKPITC